MAARFAYTNLLQGAGVVVTSNSQQAEYPDDYALNPAPWKVYRSASSSTAEWWKADLGSSQAMTCAFIRGWARPGSGAIHFQANATDSWATPTIDTAFTLPASNPTQIVALYFSSQSLRWVRFYSANAGAATGVFQLGVPFVGTYFEPTQSVMPGVSLALMDPSPLVLSPDGQAQAIARTRVRAFTSRYRNTSATDRDTFLSMYQTNGVRTPLFYALDHSNVDLTLYGRFSSQLVAQHQGDSLNLWTHDVPFVEER